MFKNTEKIINYKRKNLKVLELSIINTEKDIEIELEKRNWSKLNLLHTLLKKLKIKFERLSNIILEENNFKSKPTIIASKISKWYEIFPYIKCENLLVVLSYNFKACRKIYERLKKVNFKYMHVLGYPGSNVFILGQINLNDIQKIGTICLCFSKFISTNCSANPIILTDSTYIKPTKTAFEIATYKTYSCKIEEIYLHYNKITYTFDYVLTKNFEDVFILIVDLNNTKQKLANNIIQKINLKYQILLNKEYLMKIIPNKMNIKL